MGGISWSQSGLVSAATGDDNFDTGIGGMRFNAKLQATQPKTQNLPLPNGYSFSSNALTFIFCQLFGQANGGNH